MSHPPEQKRPDSLPKPKTAWYCLRTQRKREHIAAALLDRIDGVAVFCPRISQFKKTKTGKKRFTEAMFPSYIFANFDYTTQYRQVIHSQGVSRLVENGDKRVIPENVIEELMATLPGGVVEVADPSLTPGAKVEILEGSLKGLNGSVIAQLPAQDRVEVLLEFLGREIRVALDSDAVTLSEDQPEG
ncbi:MAG: transcription termination/antitermination protein NusG [Opitutales bacterium]